MTRRCDRCDAETHETTQCPFYSRPRDDGVVVSDGNQKAASETAAAPPVVMQLHQVRVPGDGDCLFTALAVQVGMKNDGNSGRVLRRIMARVLEKHAQTSLTVAGMPLATWIRADSGSSVPQYCASLRAGRWGGGIELAAFAQQYRMDVDVFEPTSRASYYRRIAHFPAGPQPPPARGKRRTMRLLYTGGCHYDALLLTNAAAK